MENFDTYFFDFESAYIKSLRNKKVLAKNKQIEASQICYYDGSLETNAPKNCIHVAFNEFVEYFSQTRYRLPQKVQTSSSNIEQKFYKKLELVNEMILNKVHSLEIKTKQLKLNFKDERLRIFAHACRETILIKHFVKKIIHIAETLGFEVYLHQEDNDLQICSRVAYLEAFYRFNPHMTFSINHLNNTHVNDTVYNIVWFQDIMPFMLNDSSVLLQKRDFVFHLTKGLKRYLTRKGIESSYQGFCIDSDTYRIRDEILRENKIVFIGTSAAQTFFSINHKYRELICNILWKEFLISGVVSRQRRDSLIRTFEIKDIDIGYILSYIERDLTLIYISDKLLDYELVVYGRGWDIYTELVNVYRGVLSYGEEISKVYNSAHYSLFLGGYVLQQRTLESAASGCIPIVLDSRCNSSSEGEECFEKSLLFIKTPNELKKLLKAPYAVELECIVKANSYENIFNIS